MENVVGNLYSKDEDTAEYSRAVNNASKLQQMAMATDEFEEKVRRNAFDEEMRTKQFNFEKAKFKDSKEQKIIDRGFEERRTQLEERKVDLDQQRIDNQHQERMKELEITEKKLDNERVILEETQKKSKRESKYRTLEFWVGTGVKVLLTVGTLFLYAMMHKDELTFERSEHGLVPHRCKTYDDVMIKASQTILK
jgi:hypothetical protein